MRYITIPMAIAFATLWSGAASAQHFAFLSPPADEQFAPQSAVPDQYGQGDVIAPQAIAPDESQVLAPDSGQSIGDENAQLAPRLQRQIVAYAGHEAPGTIIIDTPHTFLYYVLGDGRAMRYGIGVGREGFTWSGVKNIVRKAEWPDWYPPQEMIARQPYLPRMTAGGPGNPLGARALYIGGTEYRIHGTNDPSTIGKFVSSGCIRLTNDNIIDLYNRVQVGAKVIVLPKDSTAQIEPKNSRRSARIEPAPRNVMATTGAQPSGLY